MKYLPDTNAWSYYLRAKDEELTDRIEASLLAHELVLSSVVAAELHYGAEKAKLAGEGRPAQRVTRLLQALHPESFGGAAAECYGRLRATLERRGTMIGHNDLLLAAHALALGATVITHNTREFARVPGLLVEDWQTDGKRKS